MKRMWSAWLALGLGLVGCGDVVLVTTLGTGSGGGGTGGSGANGGGAGPPMVTDRVDVVLMVDNSRSMAEKQQLLAATVPDLVSGLVNPSCLLADGTPVPPNLQPTDPSAACPAGSHRAFAPVLDMHLAVVSSSLGDHGGDVCPASQPGSYNEDMAHLLTRQLDGSAASTYQSLGFLAWDPAQTLVPPGEADAGTLGETLAAMILGTTELGCGLESQLESWYRFLVDPDPYDTIEASGGMAEPSGTDTVLLAQRKSFLRSDSLLLILLVSDENDCSIRDGGQYFYAAKQSSGSGQYHLPKPQIACATNPNDPCCRSCGQSDEGCTPKGPECAGAYDVVGDPLNLRCFDQKRRFGIDFLNPIDRYVTGLSSSTVADRNGNLVPNPLFSDLSPEDDVTTVRNSGLVFLAGIVGVPWQALARRNASTQPDMLAGLDANGRPVGGLQSAAELEANATWPVVVGDPANYVAPTDPHMIESIDPRPGLPPPSAGYMADPIIGHEYSVGNKRDDLQYACIFPLAEPVDCVHALTSCDCGDGGGDSALCEAPSGAHGTTQYFVKAYPGRRELELLRALGPQGIVAPICPAQIANPAAADYGYRPAVGAILEAVREHL
jgi:hypothetical protein